MCIDIIYLCILKGFICLKYFFFFQAAKEDGLGNEEEAKGLAEEKHAGESGEETEEYKAKEGGLGNEEEEEGLAEKEHAGESGEETEEYEAKEDGLKKI